MNRCSKLSVVVALALASAPALALNLGQIQVKSALDRPLVAVIPVHEDFPGEASHLTVALASADAFTRAGISRADIKVPLTFTVATNAKGQKVIRVTSTEPVREPYLDFLVQVTWPQGKMLREYVVLLDPLSMSTAPEPEPAVAAAPAPAPVAQAPTSMAAQPAPPPAPRPAPAPQPARAPAPSAAARADPTASASVEVQAGDTLSRIAQNHALAGVSYQQMLIALKSTNPNAFFKDNINALKAGAILRMPTQGQARAVTDAAARAAVREQNRAWQGTQTAAPTLVASAGGASTPVTGAGKSSADSDRLKLVPPKAGGSGNGGAAQATATQLRQDLARNQETLSSQKQANADLQSRVDSLQKIADQNKRLLSLKDAQIAALQTKLAQARKAKGLPPVAPAPALAAASTAGAIEAAGASSSATAMTPAATSSAAQAAGAAAATPAKAPASSTPQTASAAGQSTTTAQAKPEPAQRATPAGAPWYQQLWAKVVLAIIIILLLIGLFVSRRRKAAPKVAKASLADSFADTPPFGHDADTAVAPIDTDALDEEGAEHEYIGDDDGEDELLAQLAEHPDNVDLHLERVSLYYARGDVAQFERAAEDMRARVADLADPEWQEVEAMGRELAPDHPLFGNDDAGDGTAEDSADGDDEFGRDDDWHVEAGAEADPTNAPVEEYDFKDPDEAPTESRSEFEPSATALPDESEFDALPPLPVEPDDAPSPIFATDADRDAEVDADTDIDADADASGESAETEPESGFVSTADMDDEDILAGGFTDDPVDTKLDLARAYVDMGDHEGARAMLLEALQEGSQVQKDVAQKLLDDLD